MDSYSVDFNILTDTDVAGMALVMPMTVDAYDFLTEEEKMSTVGNCCAPMTGEMLTEFIEDAEKAHLVCEVA